MEARIQKWGNSLAVRIPKPFAAEVGLEADARVELSLQDGRIVIAPPARPIFALAGLLAGIYKSNLHREVSTGGRQGNESW